MYSVNSETKRLKWSKKLSPHWMTSCSLFRFSKFSMMSRTDFKIRHQIWRWMLSIGCVNLFSWKLSKKVNCLNLLLMQSSNLSPFLKNYSTMVMSKWEIVWLEISSRWKWSLGINFLLQFKQKWTRIWPVRQLTQNHHQNQLLKSRKAHKRQKRKWAKALSVLTEMPNRLIKIQWWKLSLLKAIKTNKNNKRNPKNHNWC